MALGCGSGDPQEETGAVTTESGDSSATPSTIDYVSAEFCAECHPRQFEEWSTSMHAYAAKSPVFDALAARTFRDTSGELGTFCTGCHSPFGTEEGEPGSITAADRSELSLEGVSCDYCHQAVDHNGVVGNNNLVIDPEAGAQGPFESDYEGAHSAEKSDFITTSEFCGTCHDVFSFPGVRLEEAYTEYLESPAAEEGVRCQDCHMGVEPGVAGERPMGPSAEGFEGEFPDREQASHFFTGPDYSLIDGFPYPDDLEASARVQAENIARTEQLLKNSARLGPIEFRDDPDGVRLTIPVESRTSGHSVPTGFSSERQMWIEVVVVNQANGEVVFESGTLDNNGDLRDAHSDQVRLGEVELDENLVNFQSRNLIRHGRLDELTVEETIFPSDANYIERRGLLPNEERVLNYLFDAGDATNLKATVRLRYRNLPPYLLRALQAGDLVERLIIFDIHQRSTQWNR